MGTIKVGVIGVGYLGRFHAQKYSALENVQLMGVADIDAEQAGKVAGECGCPAFTDYRDLLSQVDAVSIAVPTSLHHRVARTAWRQVSMFCWRNRSPSRARKRRSYCNADAKSLILQVGHLERFNPALQAMEPFLTHPVFIESNRISVFKNRGVDVDVVLDLMIHDIDIILNIIRSPIR